jgi:hypothetical protein
MSDLDRWIDYENRQWSALVTDDDGTPDLWSDLVRRTARHLLPKRPYRPRWEATSAFTPSSLPLYFLADGHPLIDEWVAYRARWEAFLERNPRCRIADLMSLFSEVDDASSWPAGREERIRDWVRSTFELPAPMRDTERLPDDWRKLIYLASLQAPDGWVYYEDHDLPSEGGRYVWR